MNQHVLRFCKQIIIIHCYNNACGIRYETSAAFLTWVKLSLVTILITPD
jgi:hypothetical protein